MGLLNRAGDHVLWMEDSQAEFSSTPVQREISFLLSWSIPLGITSLSQKSIPTSIMPRSFLRILPLLVLLFAVSDNHTKTQLVNAE